MTLDLLWFRVEDKKPVCTGETIFVRAWFGNAYSADKRRD